MDSRHSINILKEYFDRQIRNAGELRNLADTSRPFITISRETGAGGFGFSDKLLYEINTSSKHADDKWTLIDKNILEKVIEDYSLPKEIERFMPEKKISEFQIVIEQLFGLHPSEHKLVHKISMSIYKLAILGNIILVGRGANIITSGLKNGFHIRLIEPIEKRVSNAMAHFNQDRKSAKKFIETEDKGKKEYIKKYYSKNIDECGLYSLIINFGKISRKDAIELIKKKIIE
jgi:cytidylate kinase